MELTALFVKRSTCLRRSQADFGGIFAAKRIWGVGQHLSYPPCHNAFQKTERHIMTDRQLELGFGGNLHVARANRRDRRISRGAWWFAHMRQIVDRAMDLPAAGQPRPQHIWVTDSNRPARV